MPASELRRSVAVGDVLQIQRQQVLNLVSLPGDSFSPAAQISPALGLSI